MCGICGKLIFKDTIRDAKGEKIILKSAFIDILPERVQNRSKTGFGHSIAKWFRSGLAPMLKETLFDDTSERRGLLEPALLKKMVHERIDGSSDWSNRLWAFIFLELWFREFID